MRTVIRYRHGEITDAVLSELKSKFTVVDSYHKNALLEAEVTTVKSVLSDADWIIEEEKFYELA